MQVTARNSLATFLAALAALVAGACERAAPPLATATTRLVLARLFGEHMVLQRELPVPVWGESEPGARVRVVLGEHEAVTVAAADGHWRAELVGLEAGGPFELEVQSGAEVLTLGDVLVGEVWLGAGQSNMGTRMPQVEDAAREMGAADQPRLRIFMVDKEFAPEPAADAGGRWVVLTPATVGSTSAVAYYFGCELVAALDVPIGVIVSAVGGTAIESWTPRAAQDAVPELAALLTRVDAFYAKKSVEYEKTGSPEFFQRQHELALQRWEEAGGDAAKLGRRPKLVRHPLASKNHPGNLYNSMIAPLGGYGLRGVVWYQGEYNTGTSLETREALEPALYARQLETLVASWRARWGRELPFYVVQLSSWLAPSSRPVLDHGWPLVREQQARAVERLANSGLAVTLDVGDAENIHPPRKRPVGERLARLALHRTYGRTEIVDAGPSLARARREGHSFRIELEHAEGLRTSDGREPRAFALAGADRAWHAAEARLDGTRVLLTSAEVPEPLAARYAWAPNPPVNLCNAAGLPAAPFRTDDWPIVVEDLPLPRHFQGEDE
ncbi:MAG: sialate O-acetylesterase [Planctomycetes bacterium]|nr:sialate O-acetylesterase [Planctomycetota bacterium]